jgi:predicted MFS family arabinose efflux permease
MNNLASNLWKIPAFKFISDFLMIAPIIIPFYKANGLSATQILVTQAVFSLSMLIFEVPSGYLSDVIGRRKTLIICATSYPLGIFVYAFSSSFFGFLCAETILGFSLSMRSGTDSAILYDTLLQMDQVRSYKKYEGRAFFFERLGTSLASVSGGLCALVSLRFTFFANAISSLFLFPVSLSLIEPERKTRKSSNPLKDLIGIVKFSLKKREVLGIMLFSSLLLTTGIISIWGYFMYLGTWRVPLYWYGIYFALFQLASAYSSLLSHKVENLFGQKGSIYLLFLIPVFQLTIGFVNTPWIIPLMLLHATLWGMATPVFLDILNAYIESDIRATVLSVAGMIGRITYVIIGPIFGLLIDKISLFVAFLGLALYFAVIGLFSLRLMANKQHS